MWEGFLFPTSSPTLVIVNLLHFKNTGFEARQTSNSSSVTSNPINLDRSPDNTCAMEFYVASEDKDSVFDSIDMLSISNYTHIILVILNSEG